ncbi:MAG: efflux RND transporter periplasmic adaptor subunit [Isosphaeraceae bacterium]
MFLGLAAVATLAYLGRDRLPIARKSADRPLTAVARRGTLRVIVTERGNCESTVSVDGVCELSGIQNKIIELTPEGHRVEKGTIVCRFDSAEIDKNVAQQRIKVQQAKSKIETTKQELEIARNDAESELVKAEGERKVAQLNLELYRLGTNPADVAEAKSKISLASKEYDKTKVEYEQMQGLVKKGFRSPQQLRALERSMEQFDFQKTSEERRYEVKKKFEYDKSIVENQSKVQLADKAHEKAIAQGKAKVAKAESEVEAAVGTHEIEQQQLELFLQQKQKTEIVAEQSGIVAYANDNMFDSSRQIREGAQVYARQRIFTIPDLTRMQVKVNVHESMVKKIKPGLKASIRVDALPGVELVGTVNSVSNLADSTRGWLNGGVKEYSTIVGIDNTPTDASLKPGMTAEVQVMVEEIRDALQVPVQAIAEHKGAFHAFVEGPEGFKPQAVKIGETDEKYVQVTEGLKDGDVVALDARKRAAEYFRDEEERSRSEPQETPPAAGTP